MMDSKQASAALSDIDEIVKRVRQSRIYDVSSLIMVTAGSFVVVGNLATFVAPAYSGLIWPAINLGSIAASIVVSMRDHRSAGIMAFDTNVLTAIVVFYAFGVLTSAVLGHFGPREMGAFWPIYFMLFYCLAGLWFGRAFIAIGAGITALTLVGYFFIGGAAFLIWMAAVNGGGLIISGLWMRWGA